MIIVLVVYSGLLAALFALSSGKYAETVNALDNKAYPARGILPMGLYLLEAVKYSFTTTYDRKLLAAIIELNGTKHAVMLLKVHLGGKISMMLLSLLFVLFIGNVTVTDAGYIVFCVLLPAGIAYFGDRDLFERIKKRRMAIQLDFPDFVNKLTLLINAGMTVTRAWEKTAADSSRQTPLYREISSALQDIRSGIPEHKAYEEFAKRCRVPVITRFISVILQNIKKGNSELVPILRVFSNECWELRKNTAKRYGEEASTKMLLPMMLMFLAILLIVGMPAVLALKNI